MIKLNIIMFLKMVQEVAVVQGFNSLKMARGLNFNYYLEKLEKFKN